ncbi:MAG: undecaprenyldiphospho-muramoylpentapeptide beta-N-acetylglucosaminyltransferase [Gammaproteobacteria bacterium]|nr:undecaprenyldiphospho-muramoylpentapeptide beta-N-acetylglucosaminyltransferase [Gammaproteobacteria bacterium]
MSRVLIAAGGTGGHVFPALAVAERLRADGHEVIWLGTETRIESRVVPQAGFEFIAMAQAGLRGGRLLPKLAAPVRLTRSVLQARKLIRQRKIDLVLGFGGYTAGPAGVAAWSNGTPLVIHEQNAVPGLTNKLLHKIARRTLLGFAEAESELRGALVVGNPVRAEIQALAETRKEPHEGLRVLVVGGSLGAAHLNQTVPAAITDWQGGGLALRHQVGKGRVAEVQSLYNNKPANVQVDVSEFIEDMAAAYAWADVVIGRAGALTIAELACAGVPSILVPYPHAVDDHQAKNAQVLVAVGAAVMVRQNEFSPAWLSAELKLLSNQADRLSGMASAARNSAQLHATDNIVAVCNEFLEVTPKSPKAVKAEQKND